MSRREQLNQRKQDVIRRYQRADGDVGSPEVQSERLTSAALSPPPTHVLAPAVAVST
jgi:hypothetical protein